MPKALSPIPLLWYMELPQAVPIFAFAYTSYSVFSLLFFFFRFYTFGISLTFLQTKQCIKK